PGAKRAARRGEDEAGQLGGAAAGDALQHRAVLGIHGHDLPTSLARGAGDQLARHDQRFLVGKRHALAGAQGSQGRLEPRGAHDAQASPNSRKSPAVTGRTKYSESSRSSMPPWPGKRDDESLRPTSRLNSDSATSPIWAATATTTPTVASCRTLSGKPSRSST